MNDSMNQAVRLHLFFATIAAGGGHVATAKAMAQAVEARDPGAFTLTVSDYMHDLGLNAQDARHKASWRWMLAHPPSARWGQRLLDRAPTLTNRLHRRMLDALAQAAAAHLNTLNPTLVIANHGWLTVALTRAQRLYGLKVPVLSFATEPLDASALWAEPEAERFVVPSSGSLDDLVRLGVPAAQIDLVGYPVQGAFLNAPSKTAARRGLGLAERFTCLVSLGGEGIGHNAEQVVRALTAHPLGPFVVVIAGRNEALKSRLGPLHNVRTLGFVDTVAEYLAAADVVVGKAGPASVLETLAVGRPLLTTSYAGLNELKLARFVEAKGLGAYVPDPRVLSEKLTQVAAPQALERVAAASRQLGLPEMTQALASYLVTAALEGFPTHPVRLRGLA